MKYENEITVEVKLNYMDLLNLLDKYNFKIKEKYDIEDIYMLKDEIEVNNNYLDVLKNCLLIRNIKEQTKNKKTITYKYKEYNNKEEIIKQGKVDCTISSIEEGQKLLETIGYHKLIELKDHLTVMANETTEFVIQQVNNKHIYIEIEDKCNYIDRFYNSIEEMIEDLNQYNIPIKDNNYFVKKAEIELKEIYD